MPNGIDLILADHERVKALFAEYEKTREAGLIGQIVDSLTAHDQAEQAALYPLAGELLADAAQLQHFDHAHSRVKKLIEHMMALEGPPLDHVVTLLQAAVTEHVEEEESELLPALAATATPEQLAGLGARLEQAKQRVG